jgi:serine/threonine protein kinase
MTTADQRFYCKRLDVAHQIADALQYMHEQNIAYRSFGIDKVGFNLRNEVQLVDLGDAEHLVTGKSEKEPPNTSQSSFAPESLKLATDCLTSYSAPEAIEGLALTCKADSYSFSKLFSEILTLIVVRRDSSSRETQAYVSEFQRVARRLPRETLDLLERGANMDPRKRPTLRAFCETIDLARALVGSEMPRRGSSLPLLRRDFAPRSVSMTGSVH